MMLNVLVNYSKGVLRAQPRNTKQKYNQHIEYYYQKSKI